MTTYDEASTATEQATYRARMLAQLADPASVDPDTTLQPAPVAGWSESAPHRHLVEDFSRFEADESGIRAKVAATISPQKAASAGRSWVQAVIGWFDEDFIPAVAAVWDVPFQCAPSSAPLTVDASSVIQIQATGGQIFLLAQTGAVVFNSAGSYQGTLRFVARNAGVVGNVSGSTILAGKILTGPAGLSMGPSTPAQFTSGRDEETPQQAITRCLAKWPRRGAGWTRTAFDALIPEAFLPDPSTVTRWKVNDDDPYGEGSVGVIIANASGPATTEEVDTVQAYLDSDAIRPLGSGYATVTAATLDALALNITIVGDSTNVNLQADAEAALSALGAPYDIGPAILSLDIVRAVALGAAFTSIDVSNGSGDVKRLAVDIPGFRGAVSITSCSLASDHTIADGALLVITPSVTVT